MVPDIDESSLRCYNTSLVVAPASSHLVPRGDVAVAGNSRGACRSRTRCRRVKDCNGSQPLTHSVASPRLLNGQVRAKFPGPDREVVLSAQPEGAERKMRWPRQGAQGSPLTPLQGA